MGLTPNNYRAHDEHGVETETKRQYHQKRDEQALHVRRSHAADVGNVVLEVPHDNFEVEQQSAMKKAHHVTFNMELTVSDLKELVHKYKDVYKKHSFLSDPWEKTRMGIEAVFRSWNIPRAVKYHEINKITGLKGTTENMQAMVHGNINDQSCTGVLLTCNPVNGENMLYGEILLNGQGEDLMAGSHTPQTCSELAQKMTSVYKQLDENYQQYRPDPVAVMGPEKVPSAKDAKISLPNFEGNEVYKSLGSGFEQWPLLFIEQVEMAEIACGYEWPERFKVNKFGQHLRGKAELFFQQHIMRWWNTQPTLWEESSRSWNDHFLYLNALMAATNASPALVLENIVKYTEPDLRHAMMAKVDMNRPDPLQQANELIVWAQIMSDEDKFPKSFEKELFGAMAVGTASESKKDMRKCFKCNEVGHLKLNCPQLNTDSDGAKTVEPIAFSLVAGEPSLTVAPGSWILDSGASRHLTNDFALLRNVVACKDESSCVMPDGKRMDILKKGKVTLRAVVDGVARDKDEAVKKFRDFLVQFEKEFGCSVHILRTGGGGEYRNVDLFCKENGITRQVSEVSNQAANGKAERMHRTVLNMVRCMIFGSGLPLSFWGDAVEYATYILNRSPTRANEGKKSPLEVLTGRQPRLSDIVVFGSKCTAFRDPGKSSMAKRAQMAHVIGRDASTKGFKVYIPSEHKVIVTRHVQNLESLKGGEVDQCTTETVVPAAPDREPPSPDEASSVEAETGPNTPQQVPAVHRSRRKRKKSRRQAEADGDVVVGLPRSLDVLTAAVTGTEVEEASCDSTEPDPKNYHHARKSVDSAQWTAAEQEELRALEENVAWTLVKCPSRGARLHSKWVYKKKRNGAWKIERYKARLVACGDEQVLGVNYHLVFAAVMDMTSAKVILALAHVCRVPTSHGDVPDAYVKATVEEGVEILLFIPDGMKVSADQLNELDVASVKELALKLERSLYGLKQAGRLWHLHLHKALIQLGFTQCMTDACIYYKLDKAGVTIVGTYVDDLLYSADSGYLFDQETSIVELLTRFGLGQANSVLAPIGSEEPSSTDVLEVLPPLALKELVLLTPTIAYFQSLVGSLLWIARCTRPDIMFAVHCATRRSHAPTMADWKLAKRIARYLSGTRKLKLLMGGGGLRNLPVQAQCYTDVNFAGNKDDRKSVSAAIIQLNGMTIGWLCKKQSSVALSTTEAEFVAASVGGQELLGIRELMNELEVGEELPMRMLIDNQAAIVQIESVSSSAKAQHVDVCLKFMRDYTAKGIVVPKYVASEAMLADFMTKALPVPRIRELREAVGLIEDE
ncbi:unnamed protein product [Phytophthora fragariaefolia]|uniref:Unnamed protein product n=1 Tax=Phytophthora fragariaefolia TaxID=1490495 RepID=A0A9W6XEA1_9STRA|nr:unnamed protein product [Phytophthora fragariaefolia]